MADKLKGIWVFDKYTQGLLTSVETLSWAVNFTSNGKTFTELVANIVAGGHIAKQTMSTLQYLPNDEDEYVLHTNYNGWVNAAYRTIYIQSSYDEVENADTLLTFLTNRATFTPTDADIEISMNSSKGVVLKTSGKKCENDIKVTPTLEEITITESGTYTPTKVGYGKVTVDIESTATQTQEKTVNITENGSTVVTPDEGYALSKVSVNVNVEASGGDLDALCAGTISGKLNLASETLRSSAFANCPSLEKVIANNVKTAGGSVFYNDSALTSVEMPQLSAIGASMFYICTKLASVITAPITSLGLSSFYQCTNLESLQLSDELSAIPNQAFYQCMKLNLTALPRGLKTIGTSAFETSGISISEIPEGVTTIGEKAFANCTNITKLRIPSTVTSVGNYAFAYLTKCKDLIIDSVKVANNNTLFTYSAGLKTVTFTCKPASMSSSLFSNTYASITEINVPWAEGAVSGAPWGAGNATINYNYVPPVTYTVTVNLDSHLTHINYADSIASDNAEGYKDTYYLESGYVIDTVSVTIGGVEHNEYFHVTTNGGYTEIPMSALTGDIVITLTTKGA